MDKSDINDVVKALAEIKKRKYGLDYFSDSDEYKSYSTYRSAAVADYRQYRHYAGFYGLPVLKKADLFKWYSMFFEIKADLALSRENPPSPESYAKNVPAKSSKWTDRELRSLRDYVANWKNPLEDERR